MAARLICVFLYLNLAPMRAKGDVCDTENFYSALKCFVVVEWYDIALSLSSRVGGVFYRQA